MRAYLPLSHSELEIFVAKKSHVANSLFAATPQFVEENIDCDEEEIEYLLSIRAAEVAQSVRTSDTAPGIVIAVEIEPEQINQFIENRITLNSSLTWDQVQCALLTSEEDEELAWYATQEIAFNLQDWK